MNNVKCHLLSFVSVSGIVGGGDRRGSSQEGITGDSGKNGGDNGKEWGW